MPSAQEMTSLGRHEWKGLPSGLHPFDPRKSVKAVRCHSLAGAEAGRGKDATLDGTRSEASTSHRPPRLHPSTNSNT
jgi:hypothetical protein